MNSYQRLDKGNLIKVSYNISRFTDENLVNDNLLSGLTVFMLTYKRNDSDEYFYSQCNNVSFDVGITRLDKQAPAVSGGSVLTKKRAQALRVN